MLEDIHSIEIIFENLDYIVIPAHYFRAFECTGDQKTVQFMEENAVSFELDPAANRDAASFAGDVHCICTGEGTLFERLQARDITRISLAYADQTEQVMQAAWEDADRGGYRGSVYRQLHRRFPSGMEDESGIEYIRKRAPSFNERFR